jgi:hypothetical protein
MNISYEGTSLNIGGRIVETPWPVREAFELDGRVVALLDQQAHLKVPILDIREMRNAPRGRNLFCYSPDGRLQWKAEFPGGDDSEDYYYRISSRSPLKVNSFSSFRCEIDPETGRIIRKEFYK